jgi:hypothetical protein
MKTNLASRCLASVILALVAARGGAMAQEYLDPAETPLGELTDGYAPGSVIYEAPVVYNGPVLYEAPVVYNGPVYYVNRAPEFVAPAPAPDPAIGEASTVLVIGGRGGAYGYGHHGDSGQMLIRFGSEGGWFGR